MKILLASPDPWNAPIPYYIAPQRVARALTRAGHTVYNLDIHGDPYKTAGLPPIDPDTPHLKPWGMSVHSTYQNYISNLKNAVDEFKPNAVYMFGSLKFNYEMHLFSEKNLPVGFHQADPYWKRFPTKNDIKQYNMMNFMTCNEGQAWNYLHQHGMEGKVHLLNHAIDPELAPPLGAEKRYLCSIVMGGEDPPRIEDITKYYYEVADLFPEQIIIGGGGLWRRMKWLLNKSEKRQPFDASPGVTKYNITKIHDRDCETLPWKVNPEVLCHKFIHRLYSQSYYGFTPWGSYLREGRQAEYNTRTFGTKTFEMGGSGAAMLSTWIHDIEEVIIDGKTGFILHSPDDTRKAFQYAVDNPDEVRKMGEEAYRDIHKRHSWDVRYRDVLAPIFRDLGLI